MLLGPLYHLVERTDRLTALGEARRVARPGGLVMAAAINRFAPMLDGLFQGMFAAPGFAEIVAHGLATGRHDPPAGSDFFTLAYLHRPEELCEEFGAAGLVEVEVIGLEGPGCHLPDLDERYADAAAWQQLIDIAERLESEPGFLGISSHLLAVGRNRR